MRFLLKKFMLFLIILFTIPAYAEIQDKKFTKEEIKKMTETKAIIETRFGKIELRFFKDNVM